MSSPEKRSNVISWGSATPVEKLGQHSGLTVAHYKEGYYASQNSAPRSTTLNLPDNRRLLVKSGESSSTTVGQEGSGYAAIDPQAYKFEASIGGPLADIPTVAARFCITVRGADVTDARIQMIHPEPFDRGNIIDCTLDDEGRPQKVEVQEGGAILHALGVTTDLVTDRNTFRDPDNRFTHTVTDSGQQREIFDAIAGALGSRGAGAVDLPTTTATLYGAMGTDIDMSNQMVTFL